MRNPFRSETEAFRFLLRVLVAGVVVAIADAVAGPTFAVSIGVLLLVVVGYAYVRRGRPVRGLPSAPAHVGPVKERRALLLIDEPPTDSALAAVGRRSDRLLVVAPVHVSRLRQWLSDVDAARAEARMRLDITVARLRSAHVDAEGVLGDEDPLRALDDALRGFGGDEIIAATGDDGLVTRLRERYAIPVTRV